MPSADQCSKSNSTSAIDWRRGRYAGYDKPLSFHFTIDDLSIISHLGLPRQPRARNDAIRSIVIDTLIEANGLNRAISYSRNRNFYANLQRYNGTSYSYANVVQGVDLLAANGWLYTDIAPANPHLGLQSTIQPTPLLLDTFGPDIIKSNIMHNIFEPIHLNTGPKKSRRLVDYKDTQKTCRMRRQVIAINEMLASFAITLDNATDYLNSGYGLHLQFRDAQMACGVISSLKRQGIPCLPVHDSYRVATKHEGATLEAMHKAERIAGI